MKRQTRHRNTRYLYFRAARTCATAAALLVLSGADGLVSSNGNRPRQLMPTQTTTVSTSRLLAEIRDEDKGDEIQTQVRIEQNGSGDQDGIKEQQQQQHEHDNEIKFGESVPFRPKAAAAATSSFGESVPLRSPAKSAIESEIFITSENNAVVTAKNNNDDDESMEQTMERIRQLKRRNITVAILSVLLAVTNYVWQMLHPITPLQLLVEMEQQSVPITQIGKNGKPTVVDFWAPWCENCKFMAPTLQKVEEEYAGRVNFVMVNGDKAEAWPLIEAFGVDAIPHLALISDQGDVETALIGPIPKSVLEKDLDVLLENAKSQKQQALPYQMLDAFARNPELRRVQFDKDWR